MDPKGGRCLRRAFGAGLVAACGLAFSATFFLLARVVPLELPIIGPKWEYFEGQRDGYTLVAVGSSYTYRHFVPRIFDRVLGEAGIVSQSFNFGVSRLALAEAYLIVDELGRRQPKRLTWVAIDLSLFPDSGDENRLSTRDIWWHTPTETSVIVERMLKSDEPLAIKLASVRENWEPLLRNVTTAGRVARPFRAYWDDQLAADDDVGLHVKEHGYEALEDILHVPSVRERSVRFQKSKAKFAKAITQRRKRERPRALSGYKLAMLQRIAKRVAGAGFVPIFFEPPAFEGPYRTQPLRELGPVFSYNDPKRYAELYSIDQRFDNGHLTERGAAELSELFARDFGRYVEDARASP